MYHEQLSRQLSEFLTSLFKLKGEVMIVTDVFCLFNRARGTGSVLCFFLPVVGPHFWCSSCALEMVSPDDLMRAIGLFESLRLPFATKTTPNGITYVHSGTLPRARHPGRP